MTEPSACGECQACCHTLLILEPRSEAGEDCRHQCASGCGIYATRPSDCRTWSCEWLIEQDGDTKPPWTDAQRPDRLGIVFSDGHMGSTIAREVWPGASKEAAGQEAIAQWLQEVRLVLIFEHGNNTMMCDDWLPRDD